MLAQALQAGLAHPWFIFCWPPSQVDTLPMIIESYMYFIVADRQCMKYDIVILDFHLQVEPVVTVVTLDPKS